jgi:hypothetical protein
MSSRQLRSPDTRHAFSAEEAVAFQRPRPVRWTGTVCAERGDIQLQQLEVGEGWSATGPGGAFRGTLSEVLHGSAASGSDAEWTEAVIAAIERELIIGIRRQSLLVWRASGRWFHATRSENRESIRRFGLDWRRMGAAPGIAGSTEPEWAGLFLCSSIASARWFARMPRDGLTDIWAARLDGVWLEGAPDASGGADRDWAICPEPIAPDRLELIERDIAASRPA